MIFWRKLLISGKLQMSAASTRGLWFTQMTSKVSHQEWMPCMHKQRPLLDLPTQTSSWIPQSASSFYLSYSRIFSWGANFRGFCWLTGNSEIKTTKILTKLHSSCVVRCSVHVKIGVWSELQAHPIKIKTTKISSGGSGGLGISVKICTHENFPLYGNVSNSTPEMNNCPFTLQPSKCLDAWWTPNLSPIVATRTEKNMANALS